MYFMILLTYTKYSLEKKRRWWRC